jgi:hypothetical protein
MSTQNRAQIELWFSNITIGEAYMMSTSVNAGNSFPTPEVLDCLVINKGDTGTDETLRGGATIEEFEGPAALPILPHNIDVFETNVISLSVGQTLTFDTPLSWKSFFGYADTFTCVVTSVLGGNRYRIVPHSTMITLGYTLIPTTLRNITFRVNMRSTQYPGGLITRDYTGYVATLFRTNNHVDTWGNFSVARNKFLVVQQQIQSLVNSLNMSVWSGTYTKVFK